VSEDELASFHDPISERMDDCLNRLNKKLGDCKGYGGPPSFTLWSYWRGGGKGGGGRLEGQERAKERWR